MAARGVDTASSAALRSALTGIRKARAGVVTSCGLGGAGAMTGHRGRHTLMLSSLVTTTYRYSGSDKQRACSLTSPPLGPNRHPYSRSTHLVEDKNPHGARRGLPFQPVKHVP